MWLTLLDQSGDFGDPWIMASISASLFAIACSLGMVAKEKRPTLLVTGVAIPPLDVACKVGLMTLVKGGKGW